MPNIWTHVLFVDQLCNELNRHDLIQTSGHSLHLGAQGPDPFFYHNFLPFSQDEHVDEVGMKLHTEQCGPLLIDMIERGAYHKNHLQAFILGFVSHHMLDRHTHPYIHYHAGYEANKHQELETIIDTIMLERFRSIKTWKNPVHKQIKSRSLPSIAQLMDLLLDTHFPGLVEDYPDNFIHQSYRHIQFAQRVLYDPWKWKNKYFGSLVSSFSHQPVNDDKDYLNEQKNRWHHPATNEPHTSSFLDHYEEALEEGKLLFQLILSYWENPDSSRLNEIKDMIGNRSYDTGAPLSEGLVNRFSNPIV
ncbi:zinc dependent phospholipase C family protein [Halobacillus sp. B29]|uniref:zinc dependent phospholipase C family protein n=1 Tax=Halobacillus sp. B29 TaxID=3457432 RepID=UPI003FCE5489